MKMKQILIGITLIFSVITPVGLYVLWMENRYAKAEDLTKVAENTKQSFRGILRSIDKTNKRIDHQSIKDKIDYKQRQIENWKAQHGSNCGPLRRVCFDYEREIKELREKMR